MIRPITCLAVALACGSGLYLYQSKHRVQLLDEQIGQTVKSTEALREQTRMLSAEWTLLNDPERLRLLANQFLTLQTVAPGQFTSLADLDSRLPPPVPLGSQVPAAAGTVAPVPAAQPGSVPVASDDSGRSGEDEGKPADAKLAEATPDASPNNAASKDAAPNDASPNNASLTDAPLKNASPNAASPNAAAAKDTAAPGQAASPPAPRMAVTAPADALHLANRHSPAPRPAQVQTRVAADAQRPSDQRGPAQRPPGQWGAAQSGAAQRASAQSAPAQWGTAQRETALRSSDRRLAEARPVVRVLRAPAPMVQAGGSMLGMARDMALQPAPMPLPRPMPMNVVQPYSGSGG